MEKIGEGQTTGYCTVCANLDDMLTGIPAKAFDTYIVDIPQPEPSPGQATTTGGGGSSLSL